MFFLIGGLGLQGDGGDRSGGTTRPFGFALGQALGISPYNPGRRAVRSEIAPYRVAKHGDPDPRIGVNSDAVSTGAHIAQGVAPSTKIANGK